MDSWDLRIFFACGVEGGEDKYVGEALKTYRR